MQPVSYVPRVAVKEEKRRDPPQLRRGLFYKIGRYLYAVFGRQDDVLGGEADGAGRLDKYARALWLLWKVEERVLVVVGPAQYRYAEKDKDEKASVQPVQEDED